MTLGENLLLKDQKLSLEPHKWLIPIAKGYPALEAKYLNARTKNNSSIKAKTAALASVSASWRAVRDSNPEPIA